MTTSRRSCLGHGRGAISDPRVQPLASRANRLRWRGRPRRTWWRQGIQATAAHFCTAPRQQGPRDDACARGVWHLAWPPARWQLPRYCHVYRCIERIPGWSPQQNRVAHKRPLQKQGSRIKGSPRGLPVTLLRSKAHDDFPGELGDLELAL